MSEGLIVYTDGSSIDYKFGGWAVVVVNKNGIKTSSGSITPATNNVAELEGIRQALMQLPDTKLDIYTDSKYAIGVLSKNWKAQENVDLIHEIRLKIIKRINKPNFHFVKAHAGNKYNNLANYLALIHSREISK